MRKNLNGKILVIIATLLVFTYGIFGIPHGGLKESMLRRIHLGLDLKGGTHVVLQVQTLEAIGGTTDALIPQLQADLAAAGIPGATVTRSQDPSQPGVIDISGVDTSKVNDARETIAGKPAYNAFDVSAVGNGIRMVMKAAEVKAARERALDVTIETIRSRVDSLGVAEPQIQKYGFGDDQILVELPGVDDLQQVERIIQSTARLEIHEVVGGPFQTEQEGAASLTPDAVIMQGGNNGQNAFWALKRVAIVQGPDFRDARPSKSETGQDDVSFNLTTGAGDRFYAYTSANIGKSMAIVLDNKVKEVATINGAIRDNGQITGGFTKETAGELSLMLRTGSLPASIKYLETHTVGASLGAESIRKGVTASIVGLAAVLIFMLIYYRGAGINADLALLLNLVILLGFMGFTGSTLTLPGIAGVILTIGMGVDSNVLIFERIREEMRAGKNAAAGVQSGFAHAWITILDTHVTTIVSAAILFFVGTGPVRGFAVTLVFGLLANLFTAVFVSRTIFDAILNRNPRATELSI